MTTELEQEFHIVAGSYGHVLYGFDVVTLAGRKNTASTVAVSGVVLVSGATDEMIKVYDLAKQVETGTLHEQQGTINCLAFHGDTHLLSGSEDGSIVIWDVGSWDPLKTLKGHKGAVIDLSIHPSGKLALSVGRDKTLYTWNLLKGRSAFAINFKQTPTAVRWFDAGQRYAVALERTVQLYSTATGKVYRELELPSKVLDLTFGGSGEGWVAVGSNDDTIRLFNAVTGETYHSIEQAHEARVRQIAVVPKAGIGATDVLVTASTDGFIKVWPVPPKPSPDQPAAGPDNCILSQKTGDRLTCLAVLYGAADPVPTPKPEPVMAPAEHGKRAGGGEPGRARKTSGTETAAKRIKHGDPAAGSATPSDVQKQKPKNKKRNKEKAPDQ